MKRIFALINLATLSVSGAFLGCAADTGVSEELAALEQELVISGVSFASSTGKFLGATNNGGSTVTATAAAAQAWETFKLDDVNGGTLDSGDSVFIQAGGGKYLQAVNGGGSTLNANGTSKLGWETFKIVKKTGTGAIKNGDAVGLQTSTGTFVRVVNGGGSSVDASGAALGGWEELKISGLTTTTPPVTSDPTCSTGIKNGNACCPAACGACGGSGCGSRPGGTAACCTGPIISAAVSCSGSKPPCVISSSGGTGGSSGTGGSTGSGGTTGTGGSTGDGLVWRKANSTNYESYPAPGSPECLEFNGCTWAGYFAALDGKQTEAWVKANNIIAMFSAGDGNAAYNKYKLKTLRLRKNGKTIDVKVYDTCGDSDCQGCCTANATRNGNKTLIDLEKYTYQRFGQSDGVIEWACLDCGSNP